MTEPLKSEPSPEGLTAEKIMNEAETLVDKERSAPEKGATAQLNTDPTWERATLERLAFAALNEQRQARRWRNFVRLSWLAFLIVVAWFSFSHGGAPQDTLSPHSAVVEVKGEIASGADASAEMLLGALRAAFEDEGAQGIILLINSPGGSPVPAAHLHDEIRRSKACLLYHCDAAHQECIGLTDGGGV